jgi:hypothetical protein
MSRWLDIRQPAVYLGVDDVNLNRNTSSHMVKSLINRDYQVHLVKFIKQLTDDQRRGLVNSSPDDLLSLEFFIGVGRKYDKVIRRRFQQERIVYMVIRQTGDIFKPKSPIRPDPTRWFGTIYRAHLWDWSGKFGVPVNDPTVSIVYRRGGLVRYGHSS